MDFNQQSPIYIQIIDLIKKRIIMEVLKKGDKLSSVRELSLELKVNPNTVQRAYQELEREEIIFSLRGRGTFVTENNEKIKKLKEDKVLTILEEFIKDMKSVGYDNQMILKTIEKKLEEGK